MSSPTASVMPPAPLLNDSFCVAPGDLDERDVLAEVTAGDRLQAELEEFLLEVLDRLALALRTGRAAFHLVGCQPLDVRAVGGAIDRLARLLQHPVVGIEGAERRRKRGSNEQQAEFLVEALHVIPRVRSPAGQ